MGDLRTIVSSQAILLLLSLGLTLPLTTGEFDLSIGSVLEVSAVLVTYLTSAERWPVAAALIASLGVGAIVGIANGFFVVRLGIGAFIVTLATGTILTGISLAISGGQLVTGVAPALVQLGSASVNGFSVPVFIALGFAFILWYIYDHTPLGRQMYFVGAGPDTARLTGLRVDRIRWSAFVASGIVSSVSGILAAGAFGGAVPGFGSGYLLPAYAAAFLGATTIKRGKFNAWGTVIALYFLVTGVTGLELLGASNWVEQVFDGTALLVAVGFGRLTSTRLR
jgi:ribose transport system permease protein